MNCYASLTQLKNDLGISSTDDDTRLLAILNAASRYIDGFCQRHFYIKTESRYFDGAGNKLLMDDLLSVTTLKLDNDQDMTYEDTLAATDYELCPYNDYPKWMLKISEDSDYSDFADGVTIGVEIVGDWGYGDGKSATPYSDSGITVTVADASSTTLTLSAEGTIEAGQTILVEDEQMYISAVTSDDSKEATAERGVNGTTAAAHSSKAAYIYEYPDGIIQACIMIAGRLFESRGKVFDSERLGDYSYSRGQANAAVLEAEKSLLMGYRRMDAC